ncbi:MAG: TetR/AcrR family transcriptional regulator [Alphaproteobacteria bacterium]
MSKTTKDRIADAAVSCFKQYGPQRTSMADIAEAAGVSRMTLYRAFEDRPTLVSYILDRILADLAEEPRAKIQSFDTVEEALVEGSIVSLKVGQQDELFTTIVLKDTNHSVEQYMLRGSPKVREGMMQTWGPVFEKARAQHAIRTDLNDARLVELIISVHSLLFMRDDQTDDERRQFLQDFLVPAVTGKLPG